MSNDKKHKTLKWVLRTIGIVLVTGLVYSYFLYLKYKKYNDRVRQVAHVVIYKQSPIEGLRHVKFKICDGLYNYDILAINDTISENLAISDKKFPCGVCVIYEFKNGTTEEYKAENFNCSGCSGSNSYILKENGIDYIYHP